MSKSVEKFNNILSNWLIDSFRQDMKKTVYESVPDNYPAEDKQVIDNVIELCAWQAVMTHINLRSEFEAD